MKSKMYKQLKSHNTNDKLTSSKLDSVSVTWSMSSLSLCPACSTTTLVVRGFLAGGSASLEEETIVRVYACVVCVVCVRGGEGRGGSIPTHFLSGASVSLELLRAICFAFLFALFLSLALIPDSCRAFSSRTSGVLGVCACM